MQLLRSQVTVGYCQLLTHISTALVEGQPTHNPITLIQMLKFLSNGYLQYREWIKRVHTQEKIVCSLTIIQCAKSAQGVLIFKSSTENVLDAHSNVLLIITSQTARQIQHTGVQNEIVYVNNMCYML